MAAKHGYEEPVVRREENVSNEIYGTDGKNCNEK
jgi:hypothetical protein